MNDGQISIIKVSGVKKAACSFRMHARSYLQQSRFFTDSSVIMPLAKSVVEC